MSSDAFIPMAVEDPLKTAWLDCSDFGNARRLVAVARGHLLWITEPECWAFYDGRRWDMARGEIEAQRLAHRVIEHIDGEATALAEIADDTRLLQERLGWQCPAEVAQERVKALRGHAVRSGSAGMTGGMLKQARALLAASIDDFDQDPLIYNCRNATLRFVEKKGKWHAVAQPHDPLDMLMQLAGVDYDPKARCPFWEERLALLTPDPEQLVALKVLYGYSLTGLTSDQAFYVHQGKGGDGKSVTHTALAELHGDYYRHAGVKTFLQGKEGGGSEHRSDLVRLRGDVRFVTCDEPKPRSVFDGEIIKQWTGSTVTARGAHERTEVSFKPRGKLHLECNVLPRAPSDDKGFRRRFKLYQWTVSLDATPEGALPIDVVLSRLSAERSGILNWLIEGACHWLETRTIPQPRAMEQVLAGFWADSSPLLEWMSEWCDTSDPKVMGYVDGLYSHFKEWCENAGVEHVPSKTAFGRSLTDKQFRPGKDGRGKRFRWGIQLRSEGMFGASAGTSAPAPAAPAKAAAPDGPMDGDAPYPADEWDDWGEPGDA